MDIAATRTRKRRSPLSRDRAAAAYPLKLQARDIELLKHVLTARALTQHALAALAFAGPAVAVGTSPRFDPAQWLKKRLRRLADHGYLHRFDQQPHYKFDHERRTFAGAESIVCGLGRRGAAVLADVLGEPHLARLDWQKKNREFRPTSILHAVGISDFYVTLLLALSQHPTARLAVYSQGADPTDVFHVDRKGRHVVNLSEELEVMRQVIKPDSFSGLEVAADGEAPRLFPYFLEYDRSTVGGGDPQRMALKYLAYADWLATGRARDRFGFSYFTVLTVTGSRERLDNLRKIAAQLEPAGTPAPLFWFAERRAYTYREPASILRPIWSTTRPDEQRDLFS